MFRFLGATDEQSENAREEFLERTAGASKAEIMALVDDALPGLMERVRPEARTLLDMHADAGRERWVISASPIEIVQGLADALGIEGALGTVGEVVDGKYTGKLVGEFMYGPAKSRAIEKLAAERGFDLAQCYAYSDSVSDLPMMELVGHPVAVNPDSALEQVAQQRGWPIVVFARQAKQIAARTTITAGSLALAAGAYVLGRRHGRLHAIAEAAAGSHWWRRA
jgi:HAD superfamily hydrolase (TIGR01490 family)